MQTVNNVKVNFNAHIICISLNTQTTVHNHNVYSTIVIQKRI